ncbi:MAG: peptide chain release factor 1 [Candidatus Nealsonbacteria bacterium]|nr:peptide chain release factor 1 [Candidatus Nealsonbacteria bacterium]
MVSIEEIKNEYQAVLNELSDPELISDWQKMEELSKKKAHLEKIIQKHEEIEEIRNKIAENKEIIKAQEDRELLSLAETELVQLQEKLKQTEKELEEIFTGESRKTSQISSVIVEIRAGAGGDEASLFAADLYRMYSRYAASQGWKINTLDSQPTELGGFKQITFELAGRGGDVFEKMQYEGGVHRVQRIPHTEKAGRVHTSTASVAVLPKPKATEFRINPNDLKIEISKSGGPGGQNVNKRMTAVRIVHLPSGLAVASQTERNLQQNKENAMAILSAKLKEMQEEQEMEKMGETRKAQIKRAQRADKIRTYNFPQDRVTDHRIKENFHDIESIMNGNLDPLLKAVSEKATSSSETK